MSMTLNELAQLRDSGFGQPCPRHGLNLLYWFAKDCVDIDIDGHMVPKFSLKRGTYGFHPFYNRIDNNNTPLPNQNLPKYEVGNLSAPGAKKLPLHVRKKYTSRCNDSNKDRIIVCLNDDGYFDGVYVAEHTDQMGFSRSHTYRVSQGLLEIIKGLEREEFLQQMKPTHHQRQSYHEVQPGVKPTHSERPSEDDSWCIIL
ncbi:hypothetical protein P4O66_001892 [Electrophorus voltai]|uniref:Uncharacterized protein n=1 Tax=Electrophorus voltai TaxID=2609070 RepID=A0AAD8Z3W7_9TELE|nr:hypothetical protein P4O66_001892 [Electrophorus voltai]